MFDCLAKALLKLERSKLLANDHNRCKLSWSDNFYGKLFFATIIKVLYIQSTFNPQFFPETLKCSPRRISNSVEISQPCSSPTGGTPVLSQASSSYTNSVFNLFQQVQLTCIGEGPVVHVSALEIDFGAISVLEDATRYIKLSNESLIPAECFCEMVYINIIQYSLLEVFQQTFPLFPI